MHWRKPGKTGYAYWTGLGLFLALVLTTGEGCGRRFFRKQVDTEVGAVLAEKDRFPFWKIENYHVYPDPRARFADPSNPDRPPMPPDDPAARQLAPTPQKPGKAGIAAVEGLGYIQMLEAYNAENRAREKLAPAGGIIQRTNYQGPAVLGRPTSQPPGSRENLPAAPTTEESDYLLSLEQAVELGLVNSREFQSRREDLYLAALPVTLARFSFAAQFFFTEEGIREWTGSQTPEGAGNRWRFNGSAGFSKLFSTGARLLIAYANQTVIELTGSAARHTTSTSTLNLDLVQPLLAGGGRAVTLEPLTQAERNLLYDIRSYARFRKLFFVNIATGGDLDLGNVQPVRQGFLPTLLRQARVEIEEKNVRALDGFLKIFQAFEEGGTISPIQVDQVRLQKLDAEGNYLVRVQDHQDAVDRFKIQLGLPVNVPLSLDDEPIRDVTIQLKRYEQILKDYEDTMNELDKEEYFSMTKAADLRKKLQELLKTSPLVQRTERFRASILPRWEAKSKMPEPKLEEESKRDKILRRNILDRKAELERQNKPLDPKDKEALDRLEADINLIDFEKTVREYLAQPWLKDPVDRKLSKEELLERRIRLHASRFRDARSAFALVLSEAINERFVLTNQQWEEIHRVELNGIDLLREEEPEVFAAASDAALTNRLDLMNQRAQVVDAWRQIRVLANSLLGAVNVGYHLDSFTPPDEAKPLAFQGSRTRHQLNINTELPLVRLAERNNYRFGLINYQRERRELMAAEDQIVASIRRTLRQLRVLDRTYKIQQEAVELAYKQVESSLETFRAPPDPTRQEGAGSAAALTQQLLNAQRGLVQAQVQLYTIWVNFQISRMQLYRDLELMPLDSRGVWINEFASRGTGRQARRDDPGRSSRNGERPSPQSQGSGPLRLSAEVHATLP
jgi:outer membrane protein TolC